MLPKNSRAPEAFRRLATLCRDAHTRCKARGPFPRTLHRREIRGESRPNNYNYTEAQNRVGVYTPNGLNQYTSIDGGPTITYDGNGNLTSDGERRSYTYDMENHLVATAGSASSTLVYDVLGRLAQIGVDGTTTQFHYDGDALVGEYVGGAMQRRYLHGNQVEEPLVQYNLSNVGASHRRYLHADHQGSIIAQSDGAGTAIIKNAYDPYGIPATTNNGRFGYTGQTWLKELGLNYYKARIYSPKIGRFLQTDPIFYNDNLNLYSYASNDPMNRTDPPGLWSTPAHNRMISSTFGTSISPASIARIQAGSKWADSGPNQAGNRSFMHSMSHKGAGQSAAEAKALATAYVQQTLAIARELVDQGKAEQAEFVFGAAIHTVMDSYSPEHTDALGSPIPWSLSGFLPHGWGDSNLTGDFPGCNECRSDLTASAMFGVGYAMFGFFSDVFGTPGRTATVTIEICDEDTSCE